MKKILSLTAAVTMLCAASVLAQDYSFENLPGQQKLPSPTRRVSAQYQQPSSSLPRWEFRPVSWLSRAFEASYSGPAYGCVEPTCAEPTCCEPTCCAHEPACCEPTCAEPTCGIADPCCDPCGNDCGPVGKVDCYHPICCRTHLCQPVHACQPDQGCGTIGSRAWVGHGIVGQPKLYVTGQHVRNVFRFITP